MGDPVEGEAEQYPQVCDRIAGVTLGPVAHRGLQSGAHMAGEQVHRQVVSDVARCESPREQVADLQQDVGSTARP